MGVAVIGKIGRNDSCPCGSGEKYKKCCSIKDEKHPLLAINYRGEEVRFDQEKLNELTKQVDLFPFKKMLKDVDQFSNLTRKDIENIASDSVKMISMEDGIELLEELYELYNESIKELDGKTSCQKGCSACCNLYVDVSPIEAEHIRKHVLENFSVEEIERISTKVKINSRNSPTPEMIAKDKALIGEYALKKSPCAFLGDSGECEIYQVRPFNCRKFKVTSNPLHCSEPNSNNALRISLQIDAPADMSIKKINIGVFGDYFLVKRGFEKVFFYKHLSQWFTDNFEQIG
ncbi:SEC-C domain-containing protein [Paenibacillus sp. HWE-109]|uniref:YkgJ family cysteine cluster protein n=1 Tax=Paenibacillus sp. HWE-109 TaxID=1306526 RepID=UPI001EDEAB3E|nr:SEC-C metal-binding domain-containing protein [Paenibacillus sp. HWE-109]UKS30059.1 SEC-C domain-containing protein [Paenibacillus sp. HWE-109]